MKIKKRTKKKGEDSRSKVESIILILSCKVLKKKKNEKQKNKEKQERSKVKKKNQKLRTKQSICEIKNLGYQGLVGSE